MSVIKRVVEAQDYAGVGRGIHKIEPEGSNVIVWEGLEQEKIRKLVEKLVEGFGKWAVSVEEDTVILRHKPFLS